jgi:hypothetical protein
MKHSTTYFNRPTAEVIANHIADSPPTCMTIIDILVAPSARGYVIQLEYELNGETHQRVLTTVKEVDSILKSPNEFTVNTSPQMASWDRDRELY